MRALVLFFWLLPVPWTLQILFVWAKQKPYIFGTIIDVKIVESTVQTTPMQ